MHKITDSVKKHKHKFEDKYEYISIAEIMINQEYERGNKHFFVYIDVDDERLYGSFTESQFENAVNTFIQNNYSNVISPMLNARNERGQKVHTAQSAIAEYKKRLYTYKK
jgi:Flp pilus assembly CpaF family ATPase